MRNYIRDFRSVIQSPLRFINKKVTIENTQLIFQLRRAPPGCMYVFQARAWVHVDAYLVACPRAPAATVARNE